MALFTPNRRAFFLVSPLNVQCLLCFEDFGFSIYVIVMYNICKCSDYVCWIFVVNKYR